MKRQRLGTFALMVCVAVVGRLPQATAQRGTSTSSVGFAKAAIQHGHDYAVRFVMPSPNLFRVEEFVNYHEHQLPLPQGKDRVRLDVQKMSIAGGKSVVQLGITTPQELSSETMRPINLVLVVDESGSMFGEKIKNLKRAVTSMVKRIRKSDRVTIVGFENTARVILPATKKTRARKVAAAIESIRAGGGTNLHAGLMLGYEQALEHFDEERTNRVIFLTDGNANVGETESREIAKKSTECIERGVSLVTIGLGVDFNHGLLRELADSGRGVMHFINDAKDIEKTFVTEVESLLAPAAHKVKLSIEFEHLDGTPKFYGYETQLKRKSDKRYVLMLDDLNHGATQVVLAKLPSHKMNGVARLSYIDSISNERVELKCDLGEVVERDSSSVPQNFAIALVANSLHNAAIASNEGCCAQAERELKRGIKKATKLVSPKEDVHVRRVVEIASQYHDRISESRAQMASRD